jgi:hypothetical protein
LDLKNGFVITQKPPKECKTKCQKDRILSRFIIHLVSTRTESVYLKPLLVFLQVHKLLFRISPADFLQIQRGSRSIKRSIRGGCGLGCVVHLRGAELSDLNM